MLTCALKDSPPFHSHSPVEKLLMSSGCDWWSGTADWRLEIGDWRLISGDRRLEIDFWRSPTGDRCLEIGDWRWQLEIDEVSYRAGLLYFLNRKYSDFLDTWIPSWESIFMTGNPAFHIDTTLTLVFALMRPMFSAQVLRVSPLLVLLLDLHTVLTLPLKSLVLLLSILTHPCLIFKVALTGTRLLCPLSLCYQPS